MICVQQENVSLDGVYQLKPLKHTLKGFNSGARMFVSRKGSNTCIGLIPKCGNTSIRSAVLMCAQPILMENKEALTYQKRVMFMRHPIDRVKSAFSHFWTISSIGSSFGDMPIEHLYIKERGVDLDYEAFIDYILVHENPHWTPQKTVMSHNGVFVPNIVHKLKDIRHVWEDYFKGLLPWENSWSRLTTGDYRIGDLMEYYYQDLALWGEI